MKCTFCTNVYPQILWSITTAKAALFHCLQELYIAIASAMAPWAAAAMACSEALGR